jgi:hypothetical protein
MIQIRKVLSGKAAYALVAYIPNFGDAPPLRERAILFAKLGGDVECPVCGSTGAEEIAPTTFDRRRSFKCASCGEYDVAEAIYDPGLLQRLKRGDRLRVLDNAKRIAPARKRPKITSVSLHQHY